MASVMGGTGPLYGADLARVHHEGFGGYARGAAPGILAWMRRAGITTGTVVDLGCGSGIWLGELVRRGYRAVGVDPSRAFLGMARSRAPGARLVLSTAGAFDPPPCDVVTAMGEVLQYARPGSRARPPLGRIIRKVGSALRPGGLFIFDLLVAYDEPPWSYESTRAGRGWSIVHAVHGDPARRRVVREIETIVTRHGARRRSRERHRLHLFTRGEVETMLRAAGFSVRALRSYGAFRVPPRRLVFRARRR